MHAAAVKLPITPAPPPSPGTKRAEVLSEAGVMLLASAYRPKSDNGFIQDLIYCTDPADPSGRPAYVLIGWRSDEQIVDWESFYTAAEARARFETDGMRLEGLCLPTFIAELATPSTWKRPAMVAPVSRRPRSGRRAEA
jgi:hypothetical protein